MATAPPPASTETLSLKEQFFRFSERFGHLMSRIILTLLYFTLVAPAGLILSLFGDPLRIRRYSGSSWQPWTQQNDRPSDARRQD